ncbi:MAG: type II toxin-antitoxin system VapC family toxin [Acidimicrobiia bacterium]
MIVIDASAALLALLKAGDARANLELESVAVPHLADSEVAHALRSQVLRGTVPEPQAAAALATWARLSVRRFPASGLLARIWELRQNLSGYDATYVALAEALDTPLLTADARLGTAPGPRCPITVVRG